MFWIKIKKYINSNLLRTSPASNLNSTGVSQHIKAAPSGPIDLTPYFLARPLCGHSERGGNPVGEGIVLKWRLPSVSDGPSTFRLRLVLLRRGFYTNAPRLHHVREPCSSSVSRSRVRVLPSPRHLIGGLYAFNSARNPRLSRRKELFSLPACLDPLCSGQRRVCVCVCLSN